MLNHHEFRHHVTRAQLHHEMTTTPASGTKGKIVVGVDSLDHDSPNAVGEPFSVCLFLPQPARFLRV